MPHAPDAVSFLDAYFLCSRCVRRTLRIRRVRLGCNTCPVENTMETFSTDWTSLSNWASSPVSENLLNSEALLGQTQTYGRLWLHLWANRTSSWKQNLLIYCCHGFFLAIVEFNGDVPPVLRLVPDHHIHLVVCPWESTKQVTQHYTASNVNCICSLLKHCYYSTCVLLQQTR